ncbi:hypothetical protein Ddye_006246 [Dipteronia dyeriana]|uniref:MULE transposase domain-containing protein n=1 Tax=Dipteronia dyeriana TaxID=168575 RepID=A0AAE0CR00_9ROSI|nr:hypothetical protein Ddye_006246 [Dipteronia dyeriana]
MLDNLTIILHPLIKVLDPLKKVIDSLKRTMDRVRIVITYNIRWEQSPIEVKGKSNQLFTDGSGIDGRENLCGVPFEAVDHGDIVEPQLDDDFGCQIEPNLHPVDNVANNVEDEEPFEMERRARRVHRCSSTAVDIAGTSEVRPNVTLDDSENATTWIIPGAESYSFGMGGSRNLVEDEHTSMIYKGHFFPTKKDLKRLAGHFTMRHNFELKVRSFINEHTCPLEEIHRHHRQASAIIIGEMISPRLQQHNGRLMHPKDIITNMKTMYGIQIMYSKAYQALDYTLLLTYGTHEETFQLLSSFGYVLEQKDPGTITDLQCDENGKFLYFFMSLGASEWFLDNLKGALSHLDDLVFISDRHASIEAGISKVFSYATHTICCWHFYENVKKRYHRKDVAVIMDKAARAYTELQYNRYMEELLNLHPNAYDYVIVAGPHKWSPVHCPDRRNMLQRWFHDRHRAAQSMRHQLTDAEYLVILKCVDKCNFMTVNPVDWNIFSVKRFGIETWISHPCVWTTAKDKHLLMRTRFLLYRMKSHSQPVVQYETRPDVTSRVKTSARGLPAASGYALEPAVSRGRL